MNKEKIILYIEDLENKAKQSDKYFIERNELFIENQQLKDRIGKAIKYIEHYTEYYKVDGKDYLKAMRNYGLEEYQITELLELLKGENND